MDKFPPQEQRAFGRVQVDGAPPSFSASREAMSISASHSSCCSGAQLPGRTLITSSQITAWKITGAGDHLIRTELPDEPALRRTPEMTQREIVEALYAEEMAIDDFMADQSEERRQIWLEKKAVVDTLIRS
jgi:hypothetical protein